MMVVVVEVVVEVMVRSHSSQDRTHIAMRNRNNEIPPLSHQATPTQNRVRRTSRSHRPRNSRCRPRTFASSRFSQPRSCRRPPARGATRSQRRRATLFFCIVRHRRYWKTPLPRRHATPRTSSRVTGDANHRRASPFARTTLVLQTRVPRLTSTRGWAPRFVASRSFQAREVPTHARLHPASPPWNQGEAQGVFETKINPCG